MVIIIIIDRGALYSALQNSLPIFYIGVSLIYSTMLENLISGGQLLIGGRAFNIIIIKLSTKTMDNFPTK